MKNDLMYRVYTVVDESLTTFFLLLSFQFSQSFTRFKTNQMNIFINIFINISCITFQNVLKGFFFIMVVKCEYFGWYIVNGCVEVQRIPNQELAENTSDNQCQCDGVLFN